MSELSNETLKVMIDGVSKNQEEATKRTDERHRENIQSIGKIVDKLDSIEKSTDQILLQSMRTNGRVSKLEEWSNDCKKILDSNNSDIKEYKTDKARVWTAIAVLTILGGTIITLGVLAINNKIEKGISSALNGKVIQEAK